MTSLLDRQFGELMALLKELEIDEETLVIFCSDNGGGIEFADEKPMVNCEVLKEIYTKEAFESPSSLAGPRKSLQDAPPMNKFISQISFQTFAEVAGQKNSIPRNIDGISLYKLLTDANHALPDRMLYWEYPHYDWGAKNYPDSQFKQALRYKNWKMIRNGKDKEWEIL
ncbi:hypothetical protein D5R40_34225 [Okeania hirsuta]|uniref:Sulfatase N-terminal domain-containing protein n=2 Tax=Okeania hirsuta TaxID=1458930 RepID=A0A3N6NFM2_9CYAN|nr:hypothetical protein D5R40_34225 [Okeania hirsuta]